MSMDFFELAKDITRVDCQRRGLPSPDGKPASDAAQSLLAMANERFVQEFGEDTKRHISRRAISTGNGACQIIEE